MNSPLAHIHIKPSAKLVAQHTPIFIPIHWKKIIKESLDHDVQQSTITPVPIGTPVKWCSPMVVTSKTAILHHLNTQCLCGAHHTLSPFQAASSIPPNTWKTILDAVDGYHTITLNRDSQPLITFITEWSKYMYLFLPQGYLGSGDAYTK